MDRRALFNPDHGVGIVSAPSASPAGIVVRSVLTSTVMLCGCDWGHHTQFHFLRGVDRPALWMNIVFFMFVCLVPFSTSMVGRYSGQEIALLLYGSNLLAISLMLLAHWQYAWRSGLLDPSVGSETKRKVSRQILIGATVFAAGMAMAFVQPSWSLFVFLLVPVLHILPGPVHLHWTR